MYTKSCCAYIQILLFIHTNPVIHTYKSCYSYIQIATVEIVNYSKELQGGCATAVAISRQMYQPITQSQPGRYDSVRQYGLAEICQSPGFAAPQ